MSGLTYTFITPGSQFVTIMPVLFISAMPLSLLYVCSLVSAMKLLPSLYSVPFYGLWWSRKMCALCHGIRGWRKCTAKQISTQNAEMSIKQGHRVIQHKQAPHWVCFKCCAGTLRALKDSSIRLCDVLVSLIHTVSAHEGVDTGHVKCYILSDHVPYGHTVSS